MVTVDEIVLELELELEKVEALDADEACKEEVEKIYQNFYDARNKKIVELKASIDSVKRIHDKLVDLKAETETGESVEDVEV